MENDHEIVLEYQNQFLRVSSFGASLRQYWTQDKNKIQHILWGYSLRQNKKAGQGDVLIPFPGRIAQGKYTFDGVTYELKKNDKDGPNAIHGFLREREWRIIDQTKNRVEFEYSMSSKEFGPLGYPFDVKNRVVYQIGQNGFSCQVYAKNEGNKKAPWGAGFHPYFKLDNSKINDSKLTLPSDRVLEFNSTLTPTGKWLDANAIGFDFSKSKKLDKTVLNHCYGFLQRDKEGLAQVAFESKNSGLTLHLWMDPLFEYIVVYSGDPMGEPDARDSLAIEPMTCATDAFNRHNWGLQMIEPGKSISGSYGFKIV